MAYINSSPVHAVDGQYGAWWIRSCQYAALFSAQLTTALVDWNARSVSWTTQHTRPCHWLQRRQTASHL